MTEVAAAVLVRAGEVETIHVPRPRLDEDSALVEVEAAGICGSDAEYFVDSVIGRALRPFTPGHENVGRIVALGARGAERWDVELGDRVVVEEFIPCGRCGHCRCGSYRLCPGTDFRRADGMFVRYGRTSFGREPRLWGGFAEKLFIHPRAIMHKVTDDIPAEELALFVPIANGLRWVRDVAGARPGQSALIIGVGQHGLGCVVACKEIGVSRIMVTGLYQDERRLEVARALGATHTFVSESASLPELVRDATGGRGADIVIDASPDPGVIADAAESAALGGVLVLAGGKGGRHTELATDIMTQKELILRGVQGSDDSTIVPALELIQSRRYPLDRLCTDRVRLGQVGEALRRLSERQDPQSIHVSVIPHL